MPLTVDHIDYAYNFQKQVLHDVSLSISGNRIMGLIGPNGSGKSTLIKVILDLLQMQGGSVHINGHRNSSRSAKMSAMYLSSNDYLPEFLTGEEYLRFLHGLYTEPLDLKVLGHHFDRYSMSGRHRDLIEDYSHGMRKKLQLIAAFMLERRLTVIDETLNGVDIESVKIFEKDVRNLASDGRSVLLCSHDFNVLENVADDIAVLIHGALVFQGDLGSVNKDYGNLSALASEYIQSMEVE
ncbi:ABC transporter ATP-binding protein [Arthrobacter sp. MYb23]|uniref:ATP-binding cassette domain-containing protein n=1 Tax=unclassified Arthrobacter TaxID=235627 RepID=UPI000CFD5573|nr:MULTISPECIES: ABC transporter ATP-binding protein [unclassified Arthrobacter]PRB40063.1 ABC transporter ATP-binding protein [Arthrobacter sp. MYb51]PRB93475.1 ABC transporter ATP-binding protein [Arthrobacter sp. MYb23]